MKYVKLLEKFKKGRKLGKKGKKKVHFLSGIALIVDGRILMVNAKKHSKKHDDKWSIPKGHIEGAGGSLMSAIKELKEEAGIKLDYNYDAVFQYNYRKSGFTKLMDVYVYRRSREEFENYLDGWDIIEDHLEEDEISEASFLNLEEARDRIDITMSDLLDIIGI
jgi:8-oxo-dGTP pyrophosphatase MutT (NUDIX family)